MNQLQQVARPTIHQLSDILPALTVTHESLSFLRYPAIQNCYIEKYQFHGDHGKHIEIDQSKERTSSKGLPSPTVQHSYLTQCWSLVVLRSSWTLQGPKLVRKTLLEHPLQVLFHPSGKPWVTLPSYDLYNLYISCIYPKNQTYILHLNSIYACHPLDFFLKKPCTSASGAWVLFQVEKKVLSNSDHLPRLGWT